MYNLYCVTNKINGKVYAGITRNFLEKRWASHKCAAGRGSKTPLHCAIRKYGQDNFEIQLVNVFSTREDACEAEVSAIAFMKEHEIPCYNIHEGGTIGFDINNLPEERVEDIRAKMCASRQGRTPALGMKHTEENKELFGKYGKLRWDIYGRYPDEVLNYGFTEANKRFGISKTHYYRLKKAKIPTT